MDGHSWKNSVFRPWDVEPGTRKQNSNEIQGLVQSQRAAEEYNNNQDRSSVSPSVVSSAGSSSSHEAEGESAVSKLTSLFDQTMAGLSSAENTSDRCTYINPTADPSWSLPQLSPMSEFAPRPEEPMLYTHRHRLGFRDSPMEHSGPDITMWSEYLRSELHDTSRMWRYMQESKSEKKCGTYNANRRCTHTVQKAARLLQQHNARADKKKKMRPKKYVCTYCTTGFSNKGQLKGHLRIHTGERPFVCTKDDCGKKFTRNEELTRHKRIHSGERPHGCTVCAKHFGRKDHLKKHMRTHEPRGPTMFLPPHAPYTFPVASPFSPFFFPL